MNRTASVSPLVVHSTMKHSDMSVFWCGMLLFFVEEWLLLQRERILRLAGLGPPPNPMQIHDPQEHKEHSAPQLMQGHTDWPIKCWETQKNKKH